MLDPLPQHVLTDEPNLLRFDQQRFQIDQLRDQFGFFAAARIIAILDVRRVADLLDGVQQVVHLAAYFVQLGLHRIDPFVGVFAALAELGGEFIRERLQVFKRDNVIEQVIDHGLVQSLQTGSLGIAALTVRVIRPRALVIHVLPAHTFFRRNGANIHRVFFAFDVAAEHQPREQVSGSDAGRFELRLDRLPVEFLGAFGDVCLFFFKPLFRDHGGHEVFVYPAAELVIAGVNAIGEEVGVTVLVLVQPRGLMDFADLNTLVTHLPGEPGAVPRFWIGHEPPDDARFAPGASFAALMHTDLDIHFDEAARCRAGFHAEIAACARPAGIVFEEFGIVVAGGDQLRLAALDVLRDFIEKLLVLPALEGFDQRVDAGIARVGRGQQVDDGDAAQPQIGFDVHCLDAVAAQPVRLPENDAERAFDDRFLAPVAVVDALKVGAQVKEHVLQGFALVRVRRLPRLVEIELVQDQVVKRAVLADGVGLLRDGAILLLATGVAAVANDVRSRRQRAVLADEVQVAGVVIGGHEYFLRLSLIIEVCS